MTNDILDSHYLGIDLGTTNSAVALFTDGEVKAVLNKRGEVNNPSVVKVSKKGIVIGEKAKKHLHTDPKNTFKEFKRLMGTPHRSEPDLNGHCWSPEALASEVLKHLRSLAEEQSHCKFDKVVITVPALFELPQSKSTAEAARLAGFEQVELLPEPVASALASGWNDESNGKAWLVYDLGGGTFDASLLESRDGLLRVVGHDGDNFLGGRDIDRTIVQWILEQLEGEHQLVLDTDHEDYSRTLRHIESAAEQAKIRLSTTPLSIVELEFDYDDDEHEIELEFSSEQLEELCSPLIDRSIDICLRLLETQGLNLQALDRVVLVGGPAHMPIIQRLVAEKLAPIAKSEHDPMALVAQGAAIYAATINLACNTPLHEAQQETKQAFNVWLQYPSICTELNPTIMGRVVDTEFSAKSVLLHNDNHTWNSPTVDVDDSGIFILEAPVKAGSKNIFHLKAFDNRGNELPIRHPKINITHGLSMSDPPLSRSIGLALANGSVKRFIDRGTPLPAKRTFMQSTVDTLMVNSGKTLDIPIVQGERRNSRFCRKVGNLVIDSAVLKHDLYVGSSVEITIEVDRGGDLKAHALLPDQGIVIEGVAQLEMISEELAALKSSAQSLNTRLSSQLQAAFRERDEASVAQLNPVLVQLQNIMKELSAKIDVDAAQRISRNLMEIEAELEHVEAQEQLSSLAEEAEQQYYSTNSMVLKHGDSTDHRILNDCKSLLEDALKLPRQEVLERLIERLENLYQSAHEKSPEFWRDIFEHWASYANVATNPKKAYKIIETGRADIQKGNYTNLRSLAHELYALIPEKYKSQGGEGSIDSGVY